MSKSGSFPAMSDPPPPPPLVLQLVVEMCTDVIVGFDDCSTMITLLPWQGTGFCNELSLSYMHHFVFSCRVSVS